MIRPIDWRDLALLHRLRNEGLCLDSHLAYTSGRHPLQNALLDVLTPGRRTSTLVARPEEAGECHAVGQIRRHAAKPYARLTFIGPIEVLTQPRCIELLDALNQFAGESGAQHLIAEVDESNTTFESLRQTGYATYARQRIWRLAGSPLGDTTPLDSAWRLEVRSDGPAIQSLYHNLVPALVQQVEPPPAINNRGFVHLGEGELLGYLDVDHGSQGVWVQPYFHPAAERIDDLLAAFLVQYSYHPSKPIYVCVRSYQGGLSQPLEHLGFEPFNDQAVMVKRLTAAVRHPARAPLPALEGTQPEPTAPFSSMALQKKAHLRERKQHLLSGGEAHSQYISLSLCPRLLFPVSSSIENHKPAS
jgi:hypothetical protein